MLNEENPYRSPLAECVDREFNDSPLFTAGLIWGKIGSVAACLIVGGRFAALMAGATADDLLSAIFGGAMVIGVIGLGMMVVGNILRR